MSVSRSRAPAQRLLPAAALPLLALPALLAGCGRERTPVGGEAESAGPAVSWGSPQVTSPALPAVPAADPPSAGGTLTFTSMGAPGWYPSRRDPATGRCDARRDGQCCMDRYEPAGALAPWDEDVILTLRGPLLVRSLAVYRADAPGASAWKRVSRWTEGSAPSGLSFTGDAAFGAAGPGRVGNKCLVDVATERVFPCGPGSVPYCQAGGAPRYHGWDGSKLILMLASMPRFGGKALEGVSHCSSDPGDNWYDAPWIGISLGELIRADKFGPCNCYAKDPAKWWLADGCGQFNAFEVVNDNNTYKNLTVFSTNFFAYHGYVGEGPCGTACDPAKSTSAADLLDKATGAPAQKPALAAPGQGPGAAFRRPDQGFRWFAILMDAKTRTIQMALMHPDNLPEEAAGLLPSLPAEAGRSTIDALLGLRLPKPPSTSLRRP